MSTSRFHTKSTLTSGTTLSTPLQRSSERGMLWVV